MQIPKLIVQVGVCFGACLTSLPPVALAENSERTFWDGIEARNVGPFRGGRATVSVGVRQQPNVYYMGTTGGVWKTENAGASWHPISDDDFGTAAVGAIAVAPSDPNVIVVGMGESPFRNIASSQGDGLYKSTDAGENWTRIGFESLRQTGEIRIHPGDPDTIWVAAQGNQYAETETAGVYKTTDGGTTWRQVLTPLNATTGAVDLALDASNPRLLYAAMWDNHRTPWSLRSGGPGSGIWRSMDGGENWAQLKEGLPDGMGKIGVAVSPAKAGRVWAIIEAEDKKAGFYRSDDGGDSWTQLNTDRILMARSWYYMHVFADPVDENTVYVLNSPFMKSIDGGKTFARVQTPHVDNHYLWINPDNPKWMVNANDGGANVSFDGGATWSRQDNQPTAQFYRVNTDNAFEYRIYGGQQDNTSLAIKSRSRDGRIGRDDWEVHGGCESAYVATDPDNPRYTYGSCLVGLIDEFDTQTRTTRSVKAYEDLALGVEARDSKYRFNWNAPVHVSTHDPSVIYHGANVLLKSSDRGFSWTEASPDLTRNEDDKQRKSAGPYLNENIEQYNTIFAFAESPHDANVLWVGTDDGLVKITRDGGETWRDVTPSGVGRGLVNSIDVSPHDPATAYVVAMKYKDGDNRPYAWRTTNYGRSWSSVTRGLPKDHFVRVVREDPVRQGLLFAGMERGLFVSFNGGDRWEPFQSNLPIVPITDLTLRRNDLVLSTQGRGFWVFDDIAPLRQFEAGHLETTVHLYAPSKAYRMAPTSGGYGGGESTAPSAPDGVVLYYSLGEEPKLDVEGASELVISILDAEGNTVRTLKSDAKKGNDGSGGAGNFALPAQKGLNRVVWDMRTDPTVTRKAKFVFGAAPGETVVGGYKVAPGTYTVQMTYGDVQQAQKVDIAWDPINTYDPAKISEQQAFLAETHSMINALYQRLASLDAVREQVALRKSVAEKGEDEATKAAAETLLEALDAWRASASTPQWETFQDVINYAPTIDTFLITLYQQADSAVLGLTRGQRDRLFDLKPQWQRVIEQWDVLMAEDLPAFNRIAGPAVAAPAWSAE
ncbi:MAG: hypothetical protein AAF610_00480 [Pseudomonadota bacterium]